MGTPAVEQLSFQNVLTPATAASGFGKVFSVGRKSVTCRLTTDTDDDAGADDAFSLYAVQAFNQDTLAPTVSYLIEEKDPIGGTSFPLLLGGNMTQAEIVIRGYYVWKKIAITTPNVGVEIAEGFEATGH